MALEALRRDADIALDTGELNVNQLRNRITEMFSEQQDDDLMRTTVMSFGFKHGLPLDVDMVFDVRFLPNPHWIDELRPQTGLDEAVRDFVLAAPEAQRFVQQAEEIEHLLNLATTNKTDFFREAAHFEVLAQEVIPAWRAQRTDGTFRVWCAGCGTGEEAYTLAMVLLEQQVRGTFKFTIYATDVSTRALETAMRAVYTEEHISPIPGHLQKKYLMRSRDRSEKLVRIVPQVRDCVRYAHLNFLAPDYGLKDTFDVIFFRNVMIYFDRETQQQVVSKMCRNLRIGGHLFISHSETLQGQPLPIKLLGTSFYQHVPEKPRK